MTGIVKKVATSTAETTSNIFEAAIPEAFTADPEIHMESGDPDTIAMGPAPAALGFSERGE